MATAAKTGGDDVSTVPAEAFSMLGGLLHRQGVRFRLVRGRSDTVRLGLALGVGFWLVLVALLFAEGFGGSILSLGLLGEHVRLLISIPLLFLAEALWDSQLRVFIGGVVRTQIVPVSEAPRFEGLLASSRRATNSVLPDLICLAAAVCLIVASPPVLLAGVSSSHLPHRTEAAPSLSDRWYWYVCLTLYRFLLLRWAWRLTAWCLLLWRIARIRLHLVATHPDGAGGLGLLEVVQSQLVTLVVALSAVQAASLAEVLSTSGSLASSTYTAIALTILAEALIVFGPLFLFMPVLLDCRRRGLDDYGLFASRYVSDFEDKWIRARPAPPDSELLGTADLQSLADLSNSFAIITRMGPVPLSTRTLTLFVVLAVAPIAPVLLLLYPIDAIAKHVFKTVLGL
jgi:hypothetical protein